MLRFIAILFGIAFIFVGVAGFVPALSQNGKMLDFFTINPIQSIVFIATGVIAIMSATCYCTTRLFFQIMGLFYVSISVWSFWKGGDLGFIQLQMFDNILYMILGVLGLLLGFSPRQDKKHGE